MNKIWFIFLFSFAFYLCNSQNLIPNGSFEQYHSCPEGQFDSLLYWFNPCVIPYGPDGTESGSPDPFNACNSSTFMSTPLNYLGYQSTHSGNSYAGMIIYEYPHGEFREYIEVPLTGSLSPNTCYYFQMYVNLANVCSYAADTIGVYFSSSSISGLHSHTPLPYHPQVKNSTGVITDTLNWTLISGIFTASGGETHVLIGNFSDDAHTHIFNVPSNAGLPIAYYYIDDVMLTPCVGMAQQTKDSQISIYPNPFSNALIIEDKEMEATEVSLYDLTSRLLLHEEFFKTITLKTSLLEKGIYYYQLRNKTRIIKTGKIVKE